MNLTPTYEHSEISILRFPSAYFIIISHQGGSYQDNIKGRFKPCAFDH